MFFKYGVSPYSNFTVQAGPILCGFFMCDFALMQLENLHHFLNLCDHFWFNMIWHRCFVATLVFCRKLAESNATVMLSVMCGLCWWYNHVPHIVSSSTLWAYLTKRHVNLHHLVLCKWKNQREANSTKEKLDVASWLEKQEQMLGLLIIAYIQFVIMLIELKKVLSKELKCV